MWPSIRGSSVGKSTRSSWIASSLRRRPLPRLMRPRVNDATQAPGHRPWGWQPGIHGTPTWRKAMGAFTAACIARRCLHPLAALRVRAGPTSPEMLMDRAPAWQGQCPLNPLTP